MTYVNFSNDGKKFYNGEEEFIGNIGIKNVFISNVVLTKIENGTNNFTITFDRNSNLIKSEANGYATYGGKTINAQDYEA